MHLNKVSLTFLALSTIMVAGPCPPESLGRNNAGAINRQHQKIMEYHKQRREIEQLKPIPQDETPPVEIRQNDNLLETKEKKQTNNLKPTQEKENQKE